ncbi:AgmX/PglI C-terminal domain-containing protein [Pendulispora rubella]|uniref:AgmX/PglI C-terminal domain-containing protein n=1 Tax=Pendulispora rubella TaxID=2741070 RepID=A0ABZ2L0X6_9BACT
MESQGKPKVALTFALYQGDQLVRRDTIVQDIVVKIGKDPRSHLRVDDELASRMHAVIEVASPADITLIDLGNEPGTMVNGQRVNKCKIRPGDQIQIGSTLILLESAELAGQGATSQIGQMAPPPPPPAPIPRVQTAQGTGFAPVPASQQDPGYTVPASSDPRGANPFGGPPSSGGGIAGRDIQTGAAVAAQAAHAGAAANPFAANPFAAPPGSMPFAGPPPGASPFSASAQSPYGHTDVDPNAPPGTYTYKLVKSGPEVNPDEVEVAHLAAIEVMILWDTNVLHVSHLTPPRSFFVGEEQMGNIGCDYFIPSETLGTTRAPIVLARGGSAALVILPRTTGTVEIPGQPKLTIADLIQSGRARPSSEISGGYEFELPAGAKAKMELEGSGLIFQVSAVNAGKAPPMGAFAQFEPAAYAFVGLSFLIHMGIVAALAFFMPSMGADDSEAIDRDQILKMQHLLNAAAEREQEQRDTEAVQDNADNKEGGTGTRAKGEEGSMGNPTTKETGHRYGVQGPQDNPDPHIARQAALHEAAEFGMIGLLNVGGGADPNAPTAPWGREDSLGTDPMSARGNMWGDTIGDSFGAGGLGLSGVGEGGGGRGEGIGLGNIGTLGHGAGTGTGQGFGNGHGRLGGSHQTRAPSIRQGTTQVNGRLPPEVIQRIVRQNFGRFRLCYENGMRTNPNLSGRVSVKFVIDRQGAVATASDGGSELPDQGVVQCVVRGFGNLSFPQPEGGIVTVVYPIIFSPGD